jgi:hypothetical protein
VRPLLPLSSTTPNLTIATAGTAYEGAWSLSIVTERGTCEPAYRFGVQIVDGAVTYQGPGNLSGRVSPAGLVTVSVLAGDKRASGSGKLSQTSGHGRWTGGTGDDHCSGSWTAQRS